MLGSKKITINFIINDEKFNDITVPVRQHLGDFLRSIGLTGTHIGCEQGACGACTVELDGKAVRSCLILSSQINGSVIKTVEGLDDTLMKKVKEIFLNTVIFHNITAKYEKMCEIFILAHKG